MKKIFLLLAILMGIVGVLDTKAQSTYYMYSHEEGSNEFIDNLRNAPLASSTNWGIRFTAGNMSRGFVNSYGRWGFLKPASLSVLTLGAFSDMLNRYANLTIGAEGWIYTEGISIRNTLNPTESNNAIDISADGTRCWLKSYADNGGLHISSNGAHKIYLYGKTFFDESYWTSIGPGRNNDPTINNANNNKMMRIASNGGLGFWGASGAETNDTPQFSVSETVVSTAVPMYVKYVGISLFLGTAQDDKDGWIGTTTNQGVHLGANNKSVAYLGSDDNMYVGLTDDDMRTIRQELKNKYQLFVGRGTLSEDYGISPKSSWSDFVFSKNYNLLRISEVAAFIRKNNHLPDVPSAKQVAEEGYSQHDMNKILLQKIEELTLYTIQQQKEIDALKTQLQQSKK